MKSRVLLKMVRMSMQMMSMDLHHHLVNNHVPWSKGKSIAKFLIDNATGQDGVSSLQSALNHVFPVV